MNNNQNEIRGLDILIQKVKKAQKIYSAYNQEIVDKIFFAAAKKANEMRIPLAQMEIDETKMGIMEDKVIKNHFASEFVYNKYKCFKTCGEIFSDKVNGIKIIAEPLGIIAGIVPTTNPTSTAIFKALIALKTRNGIIFSPHPNAKNSTIEACKIILNAAIEAGAPNNIIGWIENPTIDLSNALMHHKDIDVILATGGPNMVKAAYSSGKPALGVGPGNVPALIDEKADIRQAVSSIIISKTFDNGMICASEQSIIAVESIYNKLIEELKYRCCHILNEDEKQKVSKTIFFDGKLNPKIVGQSAYNIAKMAGIDVEKNTKILVGKTSLVSKEEPFSLEKLSPVIALYKAVDFEDGVDIAKNLVNLAGKGHTSALHTDCRFENRINYFSKNLNTGRIIINSPSSQGAIGDIYNFKLDPSLTLGCGSWGKNSTSENVSIKHLLNYKTVAIRRENMLWQQLPPKIYFKRGAVDLALRELKNKKRAFIITDRFLFNKGVVFNITKVLEDINVDYQIFFDVKPDPNISNVNEALNIASSYEPDVIIALGGGSPIDAAKLVWLLYEQNQTQFSDIALRFMDIRKRICQIEHLGKKATFVAIPTTSGTGSEVTPFTIITDDNSHIKYALADYALTPNIAIIDPNFVDNMPKKLTAASGFDALVHSIEAYQSMLATNFTNSNALEAIKLIFKYLKRSYDNGINDPIAREKMHYAATIAGMAFANSFLGICHSLAHKLGAAFNIPHGVANSFLICQVIKYNSNVCPTKMGLFPQYKYPDALSRYCQIADELCISGENETQKVENLIKQIQKLKIDIDLPLSIKDYGIEEKEFYSKLDEIALLAFDDQCTLANPVYPMIEELKQILSEAYWGNI